MKGCVLKPREHNASVVVSNMFIAALISRIFDGFRNAICKSIISDPPYNRFMGPVTEFRVLSVSQSVSQTNQTEMVIYQSTTRYLIILL